MEKRQYRSGKESEVLVVVPIGPNISRAVKEYQKAQRRLGLKASSKSQVVSFCVELGLAALAKEVESMVAHSAKIIGEEAAKKIIANATTHENG